jgi:hypothetical protein
MHVQRGNQKCTNYNLVRSKVKVDIYSFLNIRISQLLGVDAMPAILFVYQIKVDWNAVNCTPTNAAILFFYLIKVE